MGKKNIGKFLFISCIGVVSFLIPFHFEGSTNILVGILTTLVKRLLSPVSKAVVLLLIAGSAAGSSYDYVMGKKGKEVPEWVHRRFGVSGIYLASKIFTLVMVFMCNFHLLPEHVIRASQDMVELGSTLLALAIALSFLLSFLTDGGLMEFFGEITRPFVRPMFRVPSDASLDLIASWVGASNAAVLLSAEKFRKGYYTKREAAIVMCNFSLVSIPFCMVVAEAAKVEPYFLPMYLLLCGLGIFLAMVLPRIYPLNRLEDVYVADRPERRIAGEQNFFSRAVASGCGAAEDFSLQKVWKTGINTMASILLNLMPIGIGWGILGMLTVNYTPIFGWLSWPMGWILHLLGVESAFAVAPATLAGFIDMYIPALLVTGIASVRTRFVIASLSLIQIIYITEVGAVVLQAKLGVDLKRLAVIFMERTLISLPIIVLASRLIV